MHNGKYLCYLKWVASGLNILLLQEDKFVRSQPLVNPALKKNLTPSSGLCGHMDMDGHGQTDRHREIERKF